MTYYFVRGVVFELLSAAFVIVMYQDSKVLLVLKFTRWRTNFHFGTIRKLYAFLGGRKFVRKFGLMDWTAVTISLDYYLAVDVFLGK